MAEQQTSKVTETAKAARPWRKGIPWGWVLVEGIVMLLVGLFMVFGRQKLPIALGLVLSIALSISGALQLVAAWRAKQGGVQSPLGWIRGGIGLGVGLLILILILASALSLLAGQVILGIGCIAYSGLGGYMLYLKRAEGVRLPEILSSVFFFVFGLLLVIAAFGGALPGTMTDIATVLLLLFGAFLILWSLVLRREKKAAPVA